MGRSTDVPWIGPVLAVAMLLGTPTPSPGGAICTGASPDFGDAPEGNEAYPDTHLPGHFPTCRSRMGSPGDVDAVGCMPRGTAPMPGDVAGYVAHAVNVDDPYKFWLGCGPDGIDSEQEAKTNTAPPGSGSICLPSQHTDCGFPLGGGEFFLQDECFLDADHGLIRFVSAGGAGQVRAQLQAYVCYESGVPYPGGVPAFLNILVDVNRDGDWNDAVAVPGLPGGCAYEWAVVNQPVNIEGICDTLESDPLFVGNTEGLNWVRITLSADPVPDNFPWHGIGVGDEPDFLHLDNGETEDYPVLLIEEGNIQYHDYGDAPEILLSYGPGSNPGAFPTCSDGERPTMIDDCTGGSTAGGLSGYVEHDASAFDPVHVWLGCGGGSGIGVDGEADGLVSRPGSDPSVCSPALALAVDCTEAMPWGEDYGQDECVGDGADAALDVLPTFRTCRPASLDLAVRAATVTGGPFEAYLNVLLDKNHDGDWADEVRCGGPLTGFCRSEWVIQNQPVMISGGCQTITTPEFEVGPLVGESWMRVTISLQQVPASFPIRGSLDSPGGALAGGETEDYLVRIDPPLVGVGPGESAIGTWLGAVRPNPGRAETSVRFGIAAAGPVSIRIYDVAGRRVRELVNGTRDPGEHQVQWDFRDDRGTPVPTGVYLLRLEAEGWASSQRVVRVR